MLILFDIDGTLVNTHGAGSSAMCEAGRELFGEAFTLDGVEIAGRLDPLIYADAVRLCGVADGGTHHERFRALYRGRLQERLANGRVEVLPGVSSLLERLQATEGVHLGLVTGNYPETGRLKLEAAGIDERGFRINAFGSDGEHRRELPKVAIERYRREHGESIEPERVVVIGDTPHDVDCAQANGCRSIGVGTGRTSAETLRGLGAGLALDDLADTDRVVEWITTVTVAGDA